MSCPAGWPNPKPLSHCPCLTKQIMYTQKYKKYIHKSKTLSDTDYTEWRRRAGRGRGVNGRQQTCAPPMLFCSLFHGPSSLSVPQAKGSCHTDHHYGHISSFVSVFDSFTFPWLAAWGNTIPFCVLTIEWLTCHKNENISLLQHICIRRPVSR
jgi:hypothetical protein